MKVPPEIDCKAPVKLIDRENLPEQYHLFYPESALAVRAAWAARRPLLVRGEPGVGKTQLAAAAATVFRRPLVEKVVDSRTESRTPSRAIFAPCFRERVLHHALMNHVGPALDRALVDDSYACRIGKGTLAATARSLYPFGEGHS